MSFHYEGQLVFADVTTRDQWFGRYQDYIDGEMAVQPYPGNQWAAGLEKQSHVNTSDVDGPGFSVSIRVPDDHYTTNDDPPQQGIAEQLREEVSNLDNVYVSMGAVPIQE